MKHTVYGKVREGRLDNIRHLMDCLREYEGRDVAITIKPRQARWTDQQRKYLFGVVYEDVATLAGCDVDEARQGMKDMFLSYEKNGLRCTMSEADLTLDTFEIYIRNIDLYCVENYGVNIREPE